MNSQVLILKDPTRTQEAHCVPEIFRRPRLRLVKNLVEVKGYLLRCLERMEAGVSRLPNYIMVDAGPNTLDIKGELSRWLLLHPKLSRIPILVPADVSWMARCWSTFGRWMRWW